MKWNEIPEELNNEVTAILKACLPDVYIDEVGPDRIVLRTIGPDECSAIKSEDVQKLKPYIENIQQIFGHGLIPNHDHPNLPPAKVRNYEDTIIINYKTNWIYKRQNDFTKRRGMIKLTPDLIFKNPESNLLKELFSKFFPHDIQPDHVFGCYHSLRYYGLSQDFRMVEDGEVAPTYEVIFHQNYKKSEKSDKMENEVTVEFKELKP